MAKLLLCLTVMLTGAFCSPLLNSERPPADNHREKRSYTPTPNYPSLVFSHLSDDYGGEGEWKKANCSVYFNCEEVSPLHCSSSSNRFFCSNNRGECIDRQTNSEVHERLQSGLLSVG